MTAELKFELPQVVDSTMLATLRNCEQQFAWRYGYGLREGTAACSVDLVAGGAFAAGREAAYRTAYGSEPAGETPVEDAFNASWGDFELPALSKSSKTKARTWKALHSYIEEYRPPQDRVAPKFNLPGGVSPFEWPFAIPLTGETTSLGGWPAHPITGAPFTYAGRLDAVCTLSDSVGGVTAVLDDKTTSAFRATWAPSLSLRAQFFGYVWAVQRLVDRNCSTVVVRQTAIRAGDDAKSHSEAARHREQVLEVPQYMIERWLRATQATLGAAVRAWERGYWTPALGDACTAWNRECEFAGLCRSGAPLERAAAEYTVERWDPVARGAALAAAE